MNIYLDNAASTPMDPVVLEAMMPYFCEQTGNPSSTHGPGRRLRSAIEAARRTIGGAIGAKASEIYFTSGGTEADNMAIVGAVKAYGLKHVVSTHIEHHAVTHTIEQLEADGLVTVSWLSVDGEGNIDLAELEEVLNANDRSLVSLMHGNNEIGTIYDLQAIGEVCEAHDALFHSDTVQTMGNLPLKLDEGKVHFATASAHKFYGPKGTGFLYIKKGIGIPALLLGGGQERSLRAGTENVASIVGMATALEKSCGRLDEKRAHLLSLKRLMRDQLTQTIPGVAFNGARDDDRSLPTVLNVAFPCGEQDAMLTFHLDLAGIAASGGSACSSGSAQGSHVLRGIGRPESVAMNSVRFSFGPQNTAEEIKATVATLKGIMEQIPAI